jgi:hypothetical protein
MSGSQENLGRNSASLLCTTALRFLSHDHFTTGKKERIDDLAKVKGQQKRRSETP